MKRFKVTTTEGQIYFIFADSLEAAWDNWFENWGRAYTAQSLVEQR